MSNDIEKSKEILRGLTYSPVIFSAEFEPVCSPEFKNGTRWTTIFDTENGTQNYKYQMLVEITKEQFEKLNGITIGGEEK